MRINWPHNPTVDEVYAFEGKSWQWDGVAWRALSGGGGSPTPIDLALAEFDLVSAASGSELILGPFDCDEVVLHIEDMSSTGGPTQGLELYYSTDGVAYTLWGEIATHTSDVQEHNQALHIRGMKSGYLQMLYGDSSTNALPLNGLSVGAGLARPAAQVTHFRMAWTALADFDGGAVRVMTPGGV